MSTNRRVVLSLGAVFLTLMVGCRDTAPRERVVLYCSQDREYAETILADFTKQTGIQVDTRFDALLPLAVRIGNTRIYRSR